MDDLECFRDYSEREIKLVFHQILHILLVNNPEKVSLDNFLYNDLEMIVHTEF